VAVFRKKSARALLMELSEVMPVVVLRKVLVSILTDAETNFLWILDNHKAVRDAALLIFEAPAPAYDFGKMVRAIITQLPVSKQDPILGVSCGALIALEQWREAMDPWMPFKREFYWTWYSYASARDALAALKTDKKGMGFSIDALIGTIRLHPQLWPRNTLPFSEAETCKKILRKAVVIWQEHAKTPEIR